MKTNKQLKPLHVEVQFEKTNSFGRYTVGSYNYKATTENFCLWLPNILTDHGPPMLADVPCFFLKETSCSVCKHVPRKKTVTYCIPIIMIMIIKLLNYYCYCYHCYPCVVFVAKTSISYLPLATSLIRSAVPIVFRCFWMFVKQMPMMTCCTCWLVSSQYVSKMGRTFELLA